jgi:hypothetical protein
VINSTTQAGYVAVPKAGGTVKSFELAQATFTLPQLACTSAGDRTGQEVAVGGNALSAVALCDATGNAYQIYGISACIGQSNEFLTILPGDTVKMAVNAVTGQETVTDLTTSQTWTDSNAAACGASPSAKVLTVADPSAQNVTNFIQFGFRDVLVQGTNQAKPQPLGSSAWSVQEYQLRGPSGRVDVRPEELLTGTFSSAFTNDWRAPN